MTQIKNTNCLGSHWTFEKLRKNQQMLEPLNYVIDHKKRLIITRQNYDHYQLAGKGKPVYAAGELFVNWGSIIQINNRSGSFAPQGRHLEKLIEDTFIQHGFLDAVGKYEDWLMYLYKKGYSPKPKPKILNEESFLPYFASSSIGVSSHSIFNNQEQLIVNNFYP